MASNTTTSEHYGCAGCKSAYMPSGETWDMGHMYLPSNFNPFVVSGTIPYGPRGGGGCVPSGYRIPESKENFYASSSSSWTTGGNVTPANGITYGTFMTPKGKKEPYCGATPYEHSSNTWTLGKEGYCCGPTPYVHAKSTWKVQRPYTS